MADEVLQGLLSEELLANASAISGASALRQFFASSDEVRAVRAALNDESLTETSVRLFAEHLLKDLRRGVLFSHDLTLAALAVALAERHTPFADEYLRGLAGLQAAEMPLSIRVARDVLAQRSSSASASPPNGHGLPTAQEAAVEDGARQRR